MIEQLLSSNSPTLPLFRLAFRPFFLFGALFSAIAVLVWVLVINGFWSLSLYGGGFFWHVHEMIYGFVAAIVVGFLLTAVQNWTGVKTIRGWPLALLFAIWLSGRLAFFTLTAWPLAVAIIDISFLILAAIFLAIPILKVKQWRNLFFVPVLLLLTACNFMMHLGVMNQTHFWVTQGSYSALLLICLLMVVIGGRVIPMFTANGTQTLKVPNRLWLDYLAIGCVWILVLGFVVGLNRYIANQWFGGLFILASLANAARWLRWRFWITWRVHLVWTLHLAYGFIAISLFVLGLFYLGILSTATLGWHLLTVGGIGMLIISMIARVSLGHTGRLIIAPAWMIPAFILMVISVLSRTLMISLFANHYLIWILTSGLAWSLAYIIFVLLYFSVLTQPRADDRYG